MGSTERAAVSVRIAVRTGGREFVHESWVDDSGRDETIARLVARVALRAAGRISKELGALRGRRLCDG